MSHPSSGMWLDVLLFAALAVVAGCAVGQEGRSGRQVRPDQLFVAPNGGDDWSGRLAEPNEAGDDGPFASLSRAQAAVRELIATGLKRPVAVVIRGGVYRLGEPLILTPQDSGTRDCPVTWEGQAGEAVIITGGKAVAGWKPFRDGIVVADLKEQELEGASFHQLFYRGQRQVLARHPNFDPQHPRTGGCVYVEDRGYQPRQQLFYAEGDIPFEEWDDISQTEVVSTYAGGWNFAITPIHEVDTEQRLISFRPVRNTFERGNRFFVQNVLGALDAPGEWYLDRAEGLLYFHPPDGQVVDDDVTVPLIDHLIEVRGSLPYPHGYLNVAYKGSREDWEWEEPPEPEEPVENLVFKGLRLEVARQDGIRLMGARHCSVIGCRVTNVGGVGINLGGVASAHEEVGNPRVVEAEGVSGGVGGGGQNLLYNSPCQECRAYGNDVSHAGSDGIFLYGTANVADNNHVYNTGLFDKDCACINLWGEENVARRNELHDVPRNAVFLKGIDNVVELNRLYHTMLETCDGGAIRMCQRNLTIRGNVIRHNRITDTVGYGHPRSGGAYQSPYYSWGVYLDDFTCGTTVEGNIIVRTGRGGVMLHGGSDNIVQNNIVVDAGSYQVEVVPIRDDPMSGNVVERNVLVCDPDANFPYRCTRWVPGSVAFGRNLVWTRGGPVQVDQGAGGRLFDSWEVWQDAGLDEGSVVDDPRFLDAGTDEYWLAADSPAWRLGFEKIPIGEIGCYESPDRASWPLRSENLPPREDPVLYVPPPRPVNEDFEREQVGRPPRHGDVSATAKAPIIVTDEQAAGASKMSLKIVDAEGLPNAWQPRIYYPMQYREGTVRFSCDIRLDGARPPSAYLDFRQYSETGAREYFSGPILFITPEGELRGGGDRHTLTSVPFDQWFRIEVTVALGDQATGSSEVAVTPEGGEAQRIALPHSHADFKWLERVVIASLTEHESVFYVDNVKCGPVE